MQCRTALCRHVLLYVDVLYTFYITLLQPRVRSFPGEDSGSWPIEYTFLFSTQQPSPHQYIATSHQYCDNSVIGGFRILGKGIQIHFQTLRILAHSHTFLWRVLS